MILLDCLSIFGFGLLIVLTVVGLIGLVCALVAGVVLVPMGLALGIIHFYGCPIEPNIPLWLIYYNAFAVLVFCLNAALKVSKNDTVVTIINILSTIGHIVCMILGFFFIFHTQNKAINFDNPNSSTYCHKLSYYVASIEVGYIMAFICCLWCSVFCLVLNRPKEVARENPETQQIELHVHTPKQHQLAKLIKPVVPELKYATRSIKKASNRSQSMDV